MAGAATPGPHAVSTVGTGRRFCYDASGNVIRAFAPDGVRDFAYTPYDLPETLTFGSGSSGRKVGYEYGPNREKIRRLDYDSASATSANWVTHFVGNAEVRLYASGIQEIRRYLGPVMIEQSRVKTATGSSVAIS